MGTIYGEKGARGLQDHGPVNWDLVRQFLFMEDVNPNYTDTSTRVTTAHRSASDGESDILRWCLMTGADANARMAIGRSPLHSACSENRPGCVRLLLQWGADANLPTLSGKTPLHLACKNGCYEAVLELLHGTAVVDVDAEDPEALTSDKRILRAICRYRATLDDQRQADLISQALRRLFVLFEKEEASYCILEEWAHSRVLDCLSPSCSDRSLRDFFGRASQPGGLRTASWDEFRTCHLKLFRKLGLEFRGLMHQLHELESKIFAEIAQAAQAEEIDWDAPKATPRAREQRVQRLSQPLLRRLGSCSEEKPMDLGDTPRQLHARAKCCGA